MVNNNLQFQQGLRGQVTPPGQNQYSSPPAVQHTIPPPYPGQWPPQLPSVHSNATETNEVLTQVLDRHLTLFEDRENACEQCKREKEE